MSGEMHDHQGLHGLFTFRVRVIAAFALGLVVIAPFLSNLGVTYSWSYLKLFALQTAVCIAWAGLFVVRPVRMGKLLAASGVGLPMAAILAWCLLSTTWSGSRWAATQPLVELTYMGLAVVGFANLFAGARIREWFTAAYGCAAALACLVYIPGKLLADARRATDPKAHLAVYPFDNPNVAAAFAILPMTVGVSYVIAACTGRARARAGVLGGVVAAACGAAIVVSHSAAAAAGGVGALVLTGIFSCRGKARRYLLEGLAVLVVLVLLWPLVAPGLWPKSWLAGQLGSRPAMWQGALELIRESPVVGHGIGSFPVAYSHVYPITYAAHEFRSPVVEKAHCLPLHVVCEVGLVGFLLVLFFIVCAARKAGVAGDRGDRGERALLLGLVCGCLGMLAQGLVGMPLHYVEGYTNVVLALAMIGGMANSSWGRTPPGVRPSRLLRIGAPAALVVLYALTAGPGLLSQIYHVRGWHASGRRRIRLLNRAVETGWTTFWTIEVREDLATSAFKAGDLKAALREIQTIERLAPNFAEFKRKEAFLLLRVGRVGDAANAVFDYCRKDPFSPQAYAVWLEILGAAVRLRRPALARPREAIIILSVAEKANTTRLPTKRARYLKRLFQSVLIPPNRPREVPVKTSWKREEKS